MLAPVQVAEQRTRFLKAGERLLEIAAFLPDQRPVVDRIGQGAIEGGAVCAGDGGEPAEALERSVEVSESSLDDRGIVQGRE